MSAENEAVKEVIDAMARVAEIYGFSSAAGILYGNLYFSEKPLSLDDLVRATGYSKSTVSLSMHALEHWRIVKKYRVPGDRKMYYAAEMDVATVAREFIENNLKRDTEIMVEALARAKRHIGKKGASRSVIKKIEELEKHYELHNIFIERFMDLFSKLPPEKIEQMLLEFTKEGEQ